VIATRLGGLPEIVAEGRTGLLFAPADPGDLAHTLERVWTDPEALSEMGGAARREYEAHYTAERHAELLEEVYARAIASRRASAQA
jgi:glycosyltransferase involved in cell wall biosynthesis